MQILMGPHSTIIQVDASKTGVCHIFSFIQNHFDSYCISENTLHLSYLEKNHHKHLFLMKWLYSIHKKVHKKDVEHLKQVLIDRIEKPIRIVTKKELEPLYDVMIEIHDGYIVRFLPQIQNYRLFRVLTCELEHCIVEKSYLHNRFDVDLRREDAKEKLKHLLKATRLETFNVAFIYDTASLQGLLDSDTQEDQTNRLLLEALKILDSEQNEPIEVIQKRYKQLLVKFHPDNVYSEGMSKVAEYTLIFQNLQYSYEFVKKTLFHKASLS